MSTSCFKLLMLQRETENALLFRNYTFQTGAQRPALTYLNTQFEVRTQPNLSADQNTYLPCCMHEHEHHRDGPGSIPTECMHACKSPIVDEVQRECNYLDSPKQMRRPRHFASQVSRTISVRASHDSRPKTSETPFTEGLLHARSITGIS